MGAVADGFAALAGHEFAVLTTYRRDGAAVPTTVWFAQEGDKLFIQTGANAGKVKRIRGNASVTLAPSTRIGEVLGDVVAARAHILPPGETAVAEEALQRKYGERRRQAMAQLGNMARDYIEVSLIG
jgi:PPOX class probable F420-dependent enzyme